MNKRIEAWNETLAYQKDKSNVKTCKFCGKSGLTWSQSDFNKTGKWRLFEGKEVHKCYKAPKESKPITEEEIKEAEASGKRLYQLKPRPAKNE